jgi:predicted nuclease of predicted toxin-antitoxin system
VKFLVDMPVTPEAVAYLGRAGHHAVHAASVGPARASDGEILEVARREERIVITVDPPRS